MQDDEKPVGAPSGTTGQIQSPESDVTDVTTEATHETTGVTVADDDEVSMSPTSSQKSYKEVMMQNSAIIWPWEYKTISEKYHALNFNGKEYRGRGSEISAELIGEKIGVGEGIGQDIYENDRIYTQSFDVYALKDKENEYAVGYAQNEEWLDYTIYIEKEGYYNVSAILSSGGEQSGIQLLLDGENITDTLKTAPNNEDWESYLETTANTTTKLPQGEHTLRLNIVGDWINIDKLIFETSDPTALQLLDADKNDTFEIYDSLGRKSGEIVTTQVNIAKKLKELGFGNGIYILQSSNKVLKVIVD
jgi:hypothetical protein